MESNYIQSASYSIYVEGLDDSVASEGEDAHNSQRKRGRPVGSTSKVDYWTRIMSIKYRRYDYSEKYNLNKDLEPFIA